MITIEQLAREIRPNRTVLFFGAGSSMPSGLPSGNALKDALATKFGINANTFSLAEIAQLAELKTDRRSLIEALREAIGRPAPTGALLNLPIYPWKSLFTTNYDELIETAYRRRNRRLLRYDTNFDFSQTLQIGDQLLFKLHGTIGRDISDGHQSRIIITEADYDRTSEFRENIYDRFSSELAGADLVIIGQKLDDSDIRAVIDRALSIQSKLYGGAGTVTLLLYERDQDRAILVENRGIRVCFGGIDEFFAGLAAHAARDLASPVPSTDPLDQTVTLRPSTTDARHAIDAFAPSVSSMYNGRPATYADIRNGLTFDRSVANSAVRTLNQTNLLCAGIVGASGVGKSTAARQIGVKLLSEGWHCWEHKVDLSLPHSDWVQVAHKLTVDGQQGLLIIDDAHLHLQSLNELLEGLEGAGLIALRVIYTSTQNQWRPRIKTPVLNKRGREFALTQLNGLEIDRLITLVESSDAIRPLVENSFSGFSRQQKRSRLIERCDRDMFVCLRNIFASENFDSIIMREFNDLTPPLQEVYRIISAMESSGIRVHRQLLIRTLNIPADAISNVLVNLADIVKEYDIDPRIGIFGWRVRHNVIAEIVTKFKFSNQDDFIKLFDRVIDNLSPSYDIERRTINEICNFDSGLRRLSKRGEQNRLLRRLISIAPGERVPRHRLIRNLIEDEQFDLAETEIKVFERELGRDGPVARYQASLLLGRAVYTKGLVDSDRLVLLRKAQASAKASQERFTNNRSLFAVACDIGLHIFRLSGDSEPYNDALAVMKRAELRLSDPEITKMIRGYERRFLSAEIQEPEIQLVD